MRILPWEYAVRNLARSHLRLAASLGGSALVVLLVIAAAAFVQGMQQSLKLSGSPDNIILLGAGSEESIERSEISSRAADEAAASIPGIQKRLGAAYASPEIHMANLVRLESESSESVLAVLRGVTPAAFLVHPQVSILEGRAPASGEIMVGKMAAAKMGLAEERLAVGQELWFDQRAWIISGRFEAPHTVMEAEIWTPLQDLRMAARRDSLSCIVLTMEPGQAEMADVFCKRRLDLELTALHEDAYYSKVLEFYRPIQIMAWLTAVLIAAGGLFGGLNTMYAAFASRVREAGALQALGFSRTALVLSMSQESLLACVAGSLLASGMALVFLDGLAVRFSMGAFGLVVDAPVLATGLTAGLALGLLGALPPAWRCLSLPIPEALKAS